MGGVEVGGSWGKGWVGWKLGEVGGRGGSWGKGVGGVKVGEGENPSGSLPLCITLVMCVTESSRRSWLIIHECCS